MQASTWVRTELGRIDYLLGRAQATNFGSEPVDAINAALLLNFRQGYIRERPRLVKQLAEAGYINAGEAAPALQDLLTAGDILRDAAIALA